MKDLNSLKNKNIFELVDISNTMGIEGNIRTEKQEIISDILKKYAEKGEDIYGSGILEVLPEGFGFLRSNDNSYFASPHDIHISKTFIKKLNLRTGDSITGRIRPPSGNDRYFGIRHIDSINFDSQRK